MLYKTTRHDENISRENADFLPEMIFSYDVTHTHPMYCKDILATSTILPPPYLTFRKESDLDLIKYISHGNGHFQMQIISSGMFSAGHFSSTFRLTMFSTPPTLRPGQSLSLINLTGISKIIFVPETTLIKSI